VYCDTKQGAASPATLALVPPIQQKRRISSNWTNQESTAQNPYLIDGADLRQVPAPAAEDAFDAAHNSKKTL
jgi:hypothetical protein